MKRILLADDNREMCEVLSEALVRQGYAIAMVNDGEAAVDKLRAESFDLVLCDLRMPKIDGLGVLKQVKELSPATSVIMITAFGTIENAVEAMRLGAVDYALKPFSTDELEIKIRRALERQRHDDERFLLRRAVDQEAGELVAKSPRMQDVLSHIDAAAQTLRPVLVLGKNGTGKTLMAREIHRRSQIAGGPFIVVNCVALEGEVLDIELFGSEQGVESGGAERRRGRLEMAEGGTIFLDEIGELSSGTQARLLRLLEGGVFSRIGGNEPISVGCRIMAATSRNLRQAAAEGAFREELLDKLGIHTIEIPELRHRVEDIPMLAAQFLRKYNSEFHKRVELSPEVMGILKNHAWPGNVQELENVIAQTVIISRGDKALPSSLPAGVAGPVKAVGSEAFEQSGVTSQLEAIEREIILNALAKEHWNQSRAAEQLGIKRTTLQYKLRKYGIERPER